MGGPWRISTNYGVYPRWSATSQELLFLEPTQGKVMVAPYTVIGDSFQADNPQVWSPSRYVTMGFHSPYDLHPDGQRVAVAAAKAEADTVNDKVVLLFNFFDELKRLLPVKE